LKDSFDFFKNEFDIRSVLLELSDFEKDLINFFQWDEHKKKRYSYLKKIKSLHEDIASLEKRYKDLDDLKCFEDLKDLIEEEVDYLNKRDRELSFEIEKFLIDYHSLDKDEMPCIIEIRPGVGGNEACLFAEEIANSYTTYISKSGFNFQIVSQEYSEDGFMKEYVINIESKGSYKFFRFESGVFRVQRIPVTESKGRVHTSTISLAVIPMLDSSISNKIEIKPDDLRIDVYRSSGPGGQSVNTTDSAVRITHIPTGTVVSCQNSKSQHQNKVKALEILKNKLIQKQEEEKSSLENKIRRETIQSSERSEKIRTFNFPQSRVTDHRIEKSWYNIKEIMNGDLDRIIKETNYTLRKSSYSSK